MTLVPMQQPTFFIHRWELLDDPSQSDLCKCCDSSCKPRLKRGVDSGILRHFISSLNELFSSIFI